jgi:hypothetical protein
MSDIPHLTPIEHVREAERLLGEAADPANLRSDRLVRLAEVHLQAATTILTVQAVSTQAQALSHLQASIEHLTDEP